MLFDLYMQLTITIDGKLPELLDYFYFWHLHETSKKEGK
jgi:hypothetical protein